MSIVILALSGKFDCCLIDTSTEVYPLRGSIRMAIRPCSRRLFLPKDWLCSIADTATTDISLRVGSSNKRGRSLRKSPYHGIATPEPVVVREPWLPELRPL